MRVTVIDYKAGNLASVLKALHHLGAETLVTDGDLTLIERAERLVLPGVGHFAATERLDSTGITAAIRTAIARGVPFLGICVGMQWLLEGSEEAPDQLGLGHFIGHCKRFPVGREKVPHVGWSSIETDIAGPTLFRGLGRIEYMYFTHSYYAPYATMIREDSGDLQVADAAQAEYIVPFAAALEWGNVFGVQFHPEKSGDSGLAVLRNFLNWRQKGSPC
jgi:imidazole glycerol-phosphate synthase subunit HisH